MKRSIVIATQEHFYTATKLRFFGGPKDGDEVACQLDVASLTDADGVLWQTDGGQPGGMYFTLSDYGGKFLAGRLRELPLIYAAGLLPVCHRYEVTARWIRKDTLCLNLTYRGTDN